MHIYWCIVFGLIIEAWLRKLHIITNNENTYSTFLDQINFEYNNLLKFKRIYVNIK